MLIVVILYEFHTSHSVAVYMYLAMYFSQIAFNQGRIQDFLRGGLNYRGGSLKLYIGCFIDMTSKSYLMQDLEHI